MITQEQKENKALIEAKVAELKEQEAGKPEGWYISKAVRILANEGKLKKHI
jgi:hypothetical protein